MEGSHHPPSTAQFGRALRSLDPPKRGRFFVGEHSAPKGFERHHGTTVAFGELYNSGECSHRKLEISIYSICSCGISRKLGGSGAFESSDRGFEARQYHAELQRGRC